jgi:micrococcal nuclease
VLARLVLLLAVALGAPAAAAERCIAIDGDTLVCNRQKVRLTNVYAAELNQSGGARAKRKLDALVRNRSVTLKTYGHDRYGRLLAEAYVDGRRIEQADIGPRVGRGSGFAHHRHYGK